MMDVKNIRHAVSKIKNDGADKFLKMNVTLASSNIDGVFHYTSLLPAFDKFILFELSNRSEEHTSELQSRENLVCRLLLEKKKNDHLPDRRHRREPRGTRAHDRRRHHVAARARPRVRRRIASGDGSGERGAGSLPAWQHGRQQCFFSDPATTQIYTLSLHDALPISSNIDGVFHYTSLLPAFDKFILFELSN